MGEWLLSVMAVQGFLPHGYCFQWSTPLMALMVGSDAVTMLSYYSIPVALLWFLRKRADVPFHWIFGLFAAFIFLCGTTHLADMLTIWIPGYWLQGYVKAITAVVSAMTAVALWVMMPRFLELPSNRQLHEVVRRLEHEVAERRIAETRLDELNADLERRVLERTRELEAMMAERERLMESDRARELAEAANRAKSDFLSRMSHELRTPLNAVLGFAQLLHAEGAGPGLKESQQRWVQHIRDAGQHLLDLIEDVLDIARIESQSIPLQQDPVDLAALVKECEAMLSEQAVSAGVELKVRLDAPRPAVVMTDGKRLRQVLVNLISNAVKYNRPGGRVDVVMRLEKGWIHTVVNDTRIGMSEAQLAQLFQPFNRLGRESDQRRTGTGLGLVVVKQIVEALGGYIKVRSRPDAGSEFYAAVPAG